MAENTNIEWADHTFNPWEGCTKVGPGCDHCYAETRNKRFKGGNWGAGAPRRRTSEANWKKPLRWNSELFYECRQCKWRGAIPAGGFVESSCPACHTKNTLISARPRVFCASLADVFDNEVDWIWRSNLFKLIEQTPNLDWLLLTKRIGNVQKMLDEIMLPFLPDNVWLGATIVNQEEADRDIPKLLKTPAQVRFLSMEPLLSHVDISRWLDPTGIHCMDVCNDVSYLSRTELPDIETATTSDGKEEYPLCPNCGESASWTGYDPGIDWVIVGGESGADARAMEADWVRSLREQCKGASVPFLFKQWGEHAPNWLNDDAGEKIAGSEWMDKQGKKIAGRTLDGETHTEFPA